MLPTPEINFQRTPVTLLILAVAAALEIFFLLDPDQRIYYYNQWLGILPRLWTGEPWRPFTSTLMHANLLHAAFNLYWLMIFAPPLENRFGSYRMLGLIVLLGYVSMMPEYVIGSYHRADPVMIVGLSGVVYGLFGILFIGRRHQSDLAAVCTEQTVQLLLGWFFFCIVLTYLGIMAVANIAHGAGFGFGVLYGLAIFDARRRRRWIAISVLASAVVLSTLIACPGHRGYEHAMQRVQMQQVPDERE